MRTIILTIALTLLALTACSRANPQAHWWPSDATMTLYDPSGCQWMSEAHDGSVTITGQCDAEAGQRAMDTIAGAM